MGKNIRKPLRKYPLHLVAVIEPEQKNKKNFKRG
jgi:hypothetical protein